MMEFTELPNYLEWANTRALEMLKAAPTEDGTNIFAHLLAAEETWARRITGEAGAYSLRPDWSLEECAAAIQSNTQRYRDIVSRLNKDYEVTYHNTKGEEFVSKVYDILLQVMTHGAYHRGQISAEVTRSGGEVLDTDYILFKRR